MDSYIFRFQSKLSARVFAQYPFWDFTRLELDVPSLFSQRILVNLELWLYPEFKFDGTQIANDLSCQLSVAWTLE